jgi:nitrate/nitrite transporter NarK
MLYSAILCFGVGNSGSIFCLIMTFSNWYGERGSPFVFGFGSAFSATCGALAPVGSGFSYDRLGSFAPAFYGISAACVAGAVVLWLTPPPRIRHSA